MADENRVQGDKQHEEKHPVLESATTLTGKRKKHHPALVWLVSIVCVAVICGAGYWAATELKPEEEIPEATQAPDYTTQLLSHSTDEVVSATVNYGGQTYTVLNNGDDGIAIEGMANFGLDQSAAKSLITRGTTLTTQSTVAENCEDLAAYGLDKPQATMTFKYTDGSETTLELGNKSPLTYYYLKLAGDNTVYTVYSSVATTMMTTLESLHTVEMPGTLDASVISYVKLERPGASVDTPISDGDETGKLLGDMMGLEGLDSTLGGLTLATDAPTEQPTEAPTAQPEATTEAAGADGSAAEPAADTGMTVIEITERGEDDDSLGISGYKLVQPFEYDVDSEALTKLANNISAITISSYVGNVSEENNPYGMDSAIRLTARDANDVELSFLIGNKADATNSYICIDETGDVYLTQSSLVEFARTLTVAGIVDRFANIINIKYVDGLDVTTPDGKYELKIERVPELDEEGNQKVDDNGKDIINEVYYFNGEETDGDAFKKLYQEVIGILVNGVNDDYNVEGDAVVTVTYHLNVAPGELTVEYVENDRDTYAVRRDGNTYFYVSKSKINAMLEALTSYEA